ncbi:hypothetical protein JCM14076_22250 [Methylosoma difficile]
MDGMYDFNLVMLSIMIACVASYTALDLMSHMHQSTRKSFWIWMLGSALAMGGGVWSMHFVGMLAFHLPISIGYDPVITLLSLAIAVAISAMALWLMRSSELSKTSTAAGALFVGLGIAAMHYTGMMAMRMSPSIVYDLPLVALSIGIAVFAAFVALRTVTLLQNQRSSVVVVTKLCSALLLGCAIAGMHYTGMAAAHFAAHSVSVAGYSTSLDQFALAAIVALVTFLVLVIMLATSALDEHFAAKNAQLAASLQLANEQLQRIAYYDHLTRLPSRLLLEDHLNRIISQAERSPNLLACLFIDLNKFKPVNDTFGHRMGDALLVAVAERLQDCVRMDDMVARIGGDEFVIVLGGVTDEEDVAVVCTKIINSLKQVFPIEGYEVHISCSIGISLYPRDGQTSDSLVSCADKAMYQAKALGGFAFFS